MWHKLNMFENAIKQDRYDWIWWIDFDTLITNTNVKLEDIIEESIQKHSDPDSVDLILTADWYVQLFRYLLTSGAICAQEDPSKNPTGPCIRRLPLHIKLS